MLYRGEADKMSYLDYQVHKDLVNELNDNLAWKKLALYAVEIFGFPRREWIDILERAGNTPNSRYSVGELLLQKLQELECNVGMLCDMLRKCELLDALYIIVGEEDLELTKQPYPKPDGKPYEAAIEDRISFSCKASGLPPPQYQWFHGNVEMPDETSSTLNILITSPDQGGEYQCRVSQYYRDGELMCQKYSNCAPLTVRPTLVKIIKQPVGSKVKLGEELVISCEAKGHPSPQYQWYKENSKLDGQTCSTLRIEQFQRTDAGEYRCYISNVISNMFTDEVEVKVDYPRQKATAKIALLIANSNYQNAQNLRLAENDAAVIAELLIEIGFQVICLQNLTLKEMQNAVAVFCGALTSGSYGLFYFVGHGFKMHSTYMMPVDIPQTFLRTDAFSQAELLSCALEKKPALFVGILDMCLTIPLKKSNPGIHEEKPKLCEFQTNDNLILAYSTCSYNPSYEPKDAKNGIYVSHLSKHITSNKPVYEVFMEVARSVRESTAVKTSDQKPMITTVPAVRYRHLTDAVICEKSLSNNNLYLAYLTTFNPKTVKITFSRFKVSCQVTIQPLKKVYLNVMLLITSGLEKWDVHFLNSDDRVELYQRGRICALYNLHRITQGSLVIQIGNKGIVYDQKRFTYIKYIPEILRGL